MVNELRTRAQPKAGWLLASPRLLPYVLDIVGWNVSIERNIDHTDNVNEVLHDVHLRCTLDHPRRAPELNFERSFK